MQALQVFRTENYNNILKDCYLARRTKMSRMNSFSLLQIKYRKTSLHAIKGSVVSLTICSCRIPHLSHSTEHGESFKPAKTSHKREKTH